MGGFSLWHWLVVLLIVVLIFGTKRLGGTGKDLGNAVKEFKKAMREDESTSTPSTPAPQDDGVARPKDDDDRNPPVVR